jgi:hypothetical protein
MPNPKTADSRDPSSRTLRDLVDDHLALFFECVACERLAQVDLLDVIWRLGPETKVETVRFKVVCSRCGKRRAVPLLCNFQRRRDDKWFPRPPKASR